MPDLCVLDLERWCFRRDFLLDRLLDRGLCVEASEVSESLSDSLEEDSELELDDPGSGSW